MSGCVQPPAWKAFSLPQSESKEQHTYGKNTRKRKSICVPWKNSLTSGNFRFVSCSKLLPCFWITGSVDLFPHTWAHGGFQHAHQWAMNSPSASLQAIWLLFSLVWPILGVWQVWGDFSRTLRKSSSACGREHARLPGPENRRAWKEHMLSCPGVPTLLWMFYSVI